MPTTIACRVFSPQYFGEPSVTGPFALAFSSGGSPACCQGVGVLRALHRAQLLRDSVFAYISGVSGGTWAMTPVLLENTDGTTPSLDEILAPLDPGPLSDFRLEVAQLPVHKTSALWIASEAPFQRLLFENLGMTDCTRWWPESYATACLRSLQLYRPDTPCLLVADRTHLHDFHGLTASRPHGPTPHGLPNSRCPVDGDGLFWVSRAVRRHRHGLFAV